MPYLLEICRYGINLFAKRITQLLLYMYQVFIFLTKSLVKKIPRSAILNISEFNHCGAVFLDLKVWAPYNVGLSESLDLRTFGSQVLRISGHLDLRFAGSQDVWISDSGSQARRISGSQQSRSTFTRL